MQRAMSTGLILALGLMVGACSTEPLADNSGGDDPDVTVENNDPTNNKRGLGDSCLQDSQCASGSCENNTCVQGSANGSSNNSPACAGPPGPCGDCDLTCVPSGSGSGSSAGTPGQGDPSDPGTLVDQAFDPATEGQGVVLNPDGSITLEQDDTISNDRFIWISNTGQGTVSRVNTRTLEEEGRYWTGPDGAGNDPSRTSVNSFGDVFVGNRTGGSITKISSRGENCRDVTDDGQITTSTGRNDVKPWGQDDCVKWNTKLCNDCLVRAIAAQDSDSTGDEIVEPYVWAGDFISQRIWKLNGDTGEILLETQAPVRPYGFALDRSGNLWVSGPNWGFDAEQRWLGRVDTNRCFDEASCNVAVCDGEDRTDCVKQRIPTPNGFQPYGITIDYQQRVWLGGDRVARYNPMAPGGSRWAIINPGVFVHGISADEKGFVWASAWVPQVSGNQIVGTHDGAVFQIDAERPDNFQRVNGTDKLASKGVAVDFEGKVWSINQLTQDATIIEPGDAFGQARVTDEVKNFVYPYVYSDMTGAQLRYATDQLGFWRRTFEECSPPENYFGTTWKTLGWQAEVPDPSRGSIVIRVRAAVSQQALDKAEWIPVATITSTEQSTFDLQQLFDQKGWQGASYVEVEAQFKLRREVSVMPAPPVLSAVTITKSCPEIEG